jgi:predicted O-linked N-acetylglucosamine transferase (SPINDLY family)
MTMHASKELLRRGLALHRQGRIQEAATHYTTMLGQDPNDADALHMLGVAHFELGHYEKARQLMIQAKNLRPQDPVVLSNLGHVLNALKRHDEALVACNQALLLQPDHADASLNAGVALASLKRFDEALNAFDRTLAVNPLSIGGLSNRAHALASLGRYEEALASCDRALALDPNCAEALNNRGIALAGLRRFGMALESYARALALYPEYAAASYNRGIALTELGRFDEALVSYDRVLELEPDHAEAHCNRAAVLRRLKRYGEALASSERALQLDSGLPYLLGHCLSDKMASCIWGDFDQWHARIATLLDSGGRACDPFSIVAIPSTPAQQQRCARIQIRDKFPAGPESVWRGGQYRHDRIRIGYFSADFHDHATGHLMAELFEIHDRSRFEVIAFSFGWPAPGSLRARLQRGFDRFLDVRESSDREIAALARELEIDVAVDLKGHTRGRRTGVFALRPAPIQVNYLGFPGTMGAPFIDYLIADHTLIPPEDRQYYDEKIVYLPHTYQVNDSTKKISETSSSRADLGLPERAFVFCCFNNNYKITPDVFDTWMRLLRTVEKSVFWLLADDDVVIENLCAEAERRGVSRNRLIFAPRVALAEHLARHRAADLFLDTFHCNAHTTASDALWAGLPVVTRLGQTFAGRVAASLLTAIDIPELITRSCSEYESLALNLATHPERLATLRLRLAENRRTKPLFDTPRFASNIERAYMKMHERHRAGLAPDHIEVIEG